MTVQLLTPLSATHSSSKSTEADVPDASRADDEVAIPPVPWLIPLKLTKPRVNVHCLPPVTRRAKRLIDLVLSIIMLIGLSPLLLVTAIAVKLTSPGPVIFRQTRVGLNLRSGSRDRRTRSAPCPVDEDRRTSTVDRRGTPSYGRHFTLYKFRTMRVDAEKNGAQFAVKGDPRVTPIGRFLRRTRIDELPQLINVIRGEMSLVGPRPERPEFICQLSEEIPGYLDRLGLQPGLTGVAQIVNGYDNDLTSFHRKVAFDQLYLQNCSLRNDLRILLRTIRVVLTGSGAL